ncbi:MAG: hypothetical protein EOO65_03390 [Methanosarcinales archaeon]|nr:MAG: hypothetical protein EOO65_03390 [Methanosarcinales archaeon]
MSQLQFAEPEDKALLGHMMWCVQRGAQVLAPTSYTICRCCRALPSNESPLRTAAGQLVILPSWTV